METKKIAKCAIALVLSMLLAMHVFSQVPPVPIPPVPTITGPLDPATNLPATLTSGVTTGQIYFTEPGMTDYAWVVSSPAGQITEGLGTNKITVTWTMPVGQQSVSVTYTEPDNGPSVKTVLIINYFPFASAIDPATIPKFVDPMPHFAAGLRVNAKAGGNLTVKAVPVKQVALSTGTVVGMPGGGTGKIGTTAGAGLGNYAAYQISYNGGAFGPAMWPAQTIEAQQGNQLTVQYQNELVGVRYSDFNILADQTLMMNGYTLNGNPLTDPYYGPIPMVVHLHGGEMPSGSDGGPNAWFMPTGTTGVNTKGPGFEFNASSLSNYPNQQEATTLWYHPHDDGCTRINVYTGLAGYYFLRGADEEAAQLPGWSGDSKVQEVTPSGKTSTFNGTNTYLPEIEIAIQDRMFNVNGELFWPVEPTNPDIHPFWTPEFVGDIMTVNGKTWPYLSVAPRKYRFRMLEGCNARFLNMWLVDEATGLPGPAITVIGGEGGLLQNPVSLDPAAGKALLMAPGQRYDVIIDFTGLKDKTFTLMNDAQAPYPAGMAVTPETKQIMQFVVNGKMVSADNSQLPKILRPVTPLVKLTDFAGNITKGVTPAVKRQLVLNEVSAAGGPASVLVNNAYFEGALALPGTPQIFGGPTEIPLEGTTEIVKIINISADAHPIHIHLMQWQLVSRQRIDDVGYMKAYIAAWAPKGLPEFPAGLGYPGGAGSPLRYDSINTEGAVGGNPEIASYLIPPVLPANPEEQGWKDNVIVMPGEVTTFITRIAPTDRPITATPAELMFPFDPSLGPGYVWHCHIVDHEDMSMMRPLPIAPSPLRYPQITAQPTPVNACEGLTATFSVTATSATTINYQWQLLSTVQAAVWTNLANGTPYSGVTTASLKIQPATLLLTNNKYRVILTNASGVTTSNAALLTVNPAPVPTITSVPDFNLCQLGTATYTTEPGQSNYIWTIPGTSGRDYIKISGGTNTSNNLKVTWLTLGSKTVKVNYTNLNGCTGAAPAINNINVAKWIPATPDNFSVSSNRVKQGQTNVMYTVPFVAGATYNWKYRGTGATITGTSNTVLVSFSAMATSGILTVSVNNGCGTSLPRVLFVIVDKLILKSGSFSLDADKVNIDAISAKNELKAYPNPTSGAIFFEFRISDNAKATLDITSMNGQRIARIFDADVEAGITQTVFFDKSLAAGTYIYYLKWSDQLITGKFIKTR